MVPDAHVLYSSTWGLLGPVVLSTCIQSHHILHKCQRVCKDTCLTFTPSYPPRYTEYLSLLSLFALLLPPLTLSRSRVVSHPNFTSALMVGGMSSPQRVAESLSP